jgi:hypothetical protein
VHRSPAVLAAVLVAVALTVTGCAAGEPAATRSATRSPTETVTPLPTPSKTAGEVTRSVFADGSNEDPAGPMPSTGAVAVDVACAGVDGSTMTWSLVGDDGRPLGLSGTADCSGPPTTSWLGVTAERRPAEVRVRLLPASGVVAGWAVVRRGTP